VDLVREYADGDPSAQFAAPERILVIARSCVGAPWRYGIRVRVDLGGVIAV
jgi:hypothetical protein